MKLLRNIAIIAHVDHGKTTLVDAMLKQAGLFHERQEVQTQIMDSIDLERERGITILAKNTAIQYGDWRINIVDTPGHADFGGEVERVLNMVDGVLLLVDAFDGPMPQTRFVLRKALEKKLRPIVVINKIDRPDARPAEVLDLILDLFIELGADETQIEFPVLYASAKAGAAFTDCPELCHEEHLRGGTIRPLLDAIVSSMPEPKGDAEAAFQLLVSNLDYDSYIGRLVIGRIENGTVRNGQRVALLAPDGRVRGEGKTDQILLFEGLGRKSVSEASAGEIVCLSGLEDADIGDTVSAPGYLKALPFTDVDEPTIAMTFLVNDSPFAGRDGRYVTSRHLRERLFQEARKNVALQVEEGESTERFVVKGRGELQISILMETMRREGYEFQVARPQVILKEEDSMKLEPEELLLIDVPEAYTGIVIEKLGRRKAEMISMLPPHQGYLRMEFRIPSRCLMGYRSEFLTDSRGNGIINSVISGFVAWKGDIAGRGHGVLTAFETGAAVAYGLYHAQDRGSLFIDPGTEVYEGMIVGRTMRDEDITVNVCKRKQASNMRASGSDEALRLVPPIQLSLEQCLEFIDDDELIEVTPSTIRLRKTILDTGQRLKQASARKKKQ